MKTKEQTQQFPYVFEWHKTDGPAIGGPMSKVLDIHFPTDEDIVPSNNTVKHNCYAAAWFIFSEIAGPPAEIIEDFGEDQNFKINNAQCELLSCPKCKGKLKEVYSEWARENIKKCSSCDWC